MTEKNPFIANLAQTLNARAEEFAENVIGEAPFSKTPTELRFFGKKQKAGSFLVYLDGPRRGSWRDFRDNQFGDMLDLPQHILGLNIPEAIEYAKAFLGLGDSDILPEVKRDLEKEKAEAEEIARKRLRAASFIWSNSRDPRGTKAEAYLQKRHIHLDRFPAAIRYRHLTPASLKKMGIDPVPFGKHGLDAIVYAATDDKKVVTGVQQVILDGDIKADVINAKRSNGLIAEIAAGRFADPEDELHFAEGSETALSAMISTGVPTWTTFGTSNFNTVPVPKHVKRIVILADVEESGGGITAAIWAAALWRSRGYDVLIAYTVRGDYNNLIQEEGPEAVRQNIAAAKRPARISSDDKTLVLVRDPWDGYTVWRTNGQFVRAMRKEFNPAYSMLPEFDRALVVLAPGQKDDFTPRKDTPETVFVRPSRLPMKEIFKQGGPEAVDRMLGYAAPHDRESLFGLENLALAPEADVVIVQSRKAMEAAEKLLPDCAVVAVKAAGEGAGAYDFSPLGGRRIFIAANHCPRGHQQAAIIAARARQAEATEIRMLQWPLYVLDAAGYRIAHSQVPVNYDFTALAKDGWTAEYARSLLDLSCQLSFPDQEAA